MVIYVTLTSLGLDTGPFRLYSDVDGFTLPFETNIPKTEFAPTYISYLAPNGTNIVRVKSSGACTNYVDLEIGNVSTTTTTSTIAPGTTTTTTVAPTPCLTYDISNYDLVFDLYLSYTNCLGEPDTFVLLADHDYYLCSQTVPVRTGGTNSYIISEGYSDPELCG